LLGNREAPAALQASLDDLELVARKHELEVRLVFVQLVVKVVDLARRDDQGAAGLKGVLDQSLVHLVPASETV